MIEPTQEDRGAYVCGLLLSALSGALVSGLSVWAVMTWI
jgi:hypothetical protein